MQYVSMSVYLEPGYRLRQQCMPMIVLMTQALRPGQFAQGMVSLTVKLAWYRQYTGSIFAVKSAIQPSTAIFIPFVN